MKRTTRASRGAIGLPIAIALVTTLSLLLGQWLLAPHAWADPTDESQSSESSESQDRTSSHGEVPSEGSAQGEVDEGEVESVAEPSVTAQALATVEVEALAGDVAEPGNGPATTGEFAQATMHPWALNGHTAEELAGYDGTYRVRPTGAPATGHGNYPGNVIAHVTDDSEATFWEPGRKPGTDDPATLTFTFDGPQSFSRVVYGSRLDAGLKGFVQSFEIWSSQETAGESWVPVAKGTFEGTSSSLMAIDFPETSFARLKFVFVASSGDYPSCRDMRFYKTDESEAEMASLFSDYAHLEVADALASEDALDDLERRVSVHPRYELEYRSQIERARAIVRGELVRDPAMELSTDPDAPKPIERVGDVVAMARSQLRYNSFATNRQVTGISAKTGDTITVYVDAVEGDPLPSIRFSQYYGYWSSWLGSELKLTRGVNTLTVPNFKNDSYRTKEVIGGGPIYVVNPYTPDQQSDSVRLYFENCESYPVFHKGDDEAAYLAELGAHADGVRARPLEVMDVTELVCDHAIMTVTATRADELYVDASPEANLELWDEVLHETLAFEGVRFREGEPHYDPRNERLNCNFRVSQVWDGGFMFAYTEHIGLYARGNGEDTLIDCVGEDGRPTIGWGFIHEMGHMTDLPGRTIGETTNNMPANFVNTYYLGQIRNQADIDRANAMASDRTLKPSTFNENRYNFMPFFLLESYYLGYWGTADNIYRYELDPTVEASLNSTERYVYVASLATGADLRYYFDRWGFNLSGSDPIFKEATQTQALRDLMDAAIAAGKIANNGRKPIWYLDAAQYAWMRDHGDLETQRGALYDGKEAASILRVRRTADGYSLTLPVVDDDAHLGYEVLEGSGGKWQVIGFTHGNTFTDTTRYRDGYEPRYKVRAYDRLLNATQPSPEASATVEHDVAEVDGERYDSLAEAVAAAPAGGTVSLLKDTADANVVIDKQVRIQPASASVSLARGGDAPTLTVVSGGDLTLTSNGEATLTVDGEGLAQSSPLVRVEGNGRFAFEGVTLSGSRSSDSGGAINVASSGAKGTLTDCRLEGNAARLGGALCSRGTVTATGCTFEGNRASGSGGAVANDEGGVLVLEDCELIGNTATQGGAIYANGNLRVLGGALRDNAATAQGGALCVAPTKNAQSRSTTLGSSTSAGEAVAIEDNHAPKGGALYVANSGVATLAQARVTGNGGAEDDGFDVYAITGNVVVTGDGSTLRGTLYRSSGTLRLTGGLGEGIDLTLTLGTYSCAAPVVEADFDLSGSGDRIRLAEADAYRMAPGEDGQSLWIQADDAVRLETDGGTIRDGELTGYVRGVRTLLPTMVVRDGYTFVGWFDNEACEGHSVKAIGADASGDRTYWAKWAPTLYKLTYIANGGRMPEAGPFHYTIDDGEVALGEATAGGCDFVGWHRKADLSDEAIDAIAAGTLGDITLYAEWAHEPLAPVEENVVAASCAADGSVEVVVRCSACERVIKREKQTLHVDHEFGEWVDLESPCTTGLRQRTCAVCGLFECEDEQAWAHEWQATKTIDQAPTCTEPGSRSTHCAACGATKDAESLVALGHRMEDGVCATCGLTEAEIAGPPVADDPTQGDPADGDSIQDDGGRDGGEGQRGGESRQRSGEGQRGGSEPLQAPVAGNNHASTGTTGSTGSAGAGAESSGQAGAQADGTALTVAAAGLSDPSLLLALEERDAEAVGASDLPVVEEADPVIATATSERAIDRPLTDEALDGLVPGAPRAVANPGQVVLVVAAAITATLGFAALGVAVLHRFAGPITRGR